MRGELRPQQRQTATDGALLGDNLQLVPLAPKLLSLVAARRLAAKRAATTAGVLQRRDLLAWGVPRWLVKAELRAGRWQRTGRQTVVTHNGPLDACTRRTLSVAEAGPRAALDGVSSLQHLGVEALTDELIHVIIPKGGSLRRRMPGVRVHESRRFREEDVVLRGGARCIRPATAAVHAALWARTDREAVYMLVLVVQKGLVTPTQLDAAVQQVRRHIRRRLLARTVVDLAGGVRALGELDVAGGLRRRGLPEPDRQVLRRRPTGNEYLDCRFDRYHLTLEIDGAQHDDPEHRLADLLRDLTLITEGDSVVRIPLVAWTLGSEQVLDRLEALFDARGWLRPAA